MEPPEAWFWDLESAAMHVFRFLLLKNWSLLHATDIRAWYKGSHNGAQYIQCLRMAPSNGSSRLPPPRECNNYSPTYYLETRETATVHQCKSNPLVIRIPYCCFKFYQNKPSDRENGRTDAQVHDIGFGKDCEVTLLKIELLGLILQMEKFIMSS